jgi:hypothetical protein
MKKLLIYISCLTTLALSSCQDVIDLQTEAGPSQLVVDGWITTQAGSQRIRLTKSSGYFDNTAAKPALGATVRVTDDRGTAYDFRDLKGDGNYVWQPTGSQPIGRVGGKYVLSIKLEGEEYRAATEIRRVPAIDSIGYEYKEPTVVPADAPKKGYLAEFYAKDPLGVGDCYWVKFSKNGKLYNKPNGITLAYDAAFSPGAASDGLLFIQPIRQSVTPDNGTQLYAEKDTIKVELHSISLEAYYFLFQVRQESSNQGLFAVPPANIPTNVLNVRSGGPKALGFFGSSAVSAFQTVFDDKKAIRK